MTYVIHEPVSEVPPPVLTRANRDGWSLVYKAVEHAAGQWTPVVFQHRSDAKKLAEVARKRLRPLEAEVRGSTVYLRSRRLP